MWHIYTMEYYSAIRRNEIVPSAETCMGLETVIQSEVRKRKISYNISYMWNLEKWYIGTYLQSRNRDTDIENKCMDNKRGKGGDELGDWDWHIYTIMYKIDNLWQPNIQHRELYSMLCGDQNGKEIPKREDICIHIADSLCCTAETNTTL